MLPVKKKIKALKIPGRITCYKKWMAPFHAGNKILAGLKYDKNHLLVTFAALICINRAPDPSNSKVALPSIASPDYRVPDGRFALAGLRIFGNAGGKPLLMLLLRLQTGTVYYNRVL